MNVTCPCCQRPEPVCYAVDRHGDWWYCSECGCEWQQEERRQQPTRRIRCPLSRGPLPQRCPPDCPECHGESEITVGVV